MERGGRGKGAVFLLWAAAYKRCPQVLAVNVGPGEDGGGGGHIEVEGGVAGEGEARFHPMKKIVSESSNKLFVIDMCVSELR